MDPTRYRNLGSEHLSESWAVPRALVVVASLVVVAASLVVVAANPVRVVGSMAVVVVQDWSVVEEETVEGLHFQAVFEPEPPVVEDRRFS